MFVSANMVSTVNLLVYIVIWAIFVLLFRLQVSLIGLAYFCVGLVSRTMISYYASIQVSIEQTSKTIMKLRKSSTLADG